jgi:hypothetical protein
MLSKIFHPNVEVASVITALLYASAAIASQDATNSFDVLDYVDPFIGTANGGMSDEISAWTTS